MIILFHLVLCIGTVVAQATVSSWVSINGLYPDLCLVLACLAGFLKNEYKGLLMGLTVGLFQDLLSPGGIGLNMILKGLAGSLAGATTHTISTVTVPAVILVTLVLSLVCGLASLIMAYPALDGVETFHAFSRILAPQALYQSVLAAGIFWISHKFRQSVSVVHFSQGR
ncbi:MAG: rod shape-determining protein MreD [Nitrospirota bacterium]|nr:rod shape-determining protein MreD [Nitrospirota bacterium]MDH5587085.1 rod shape-determining protein MreD [Nitrospirota bacterium]MDH5774533.1 rod shape-determining protein MreD [Nitrospirota bacterium]